MIETTEATCSTTAGSLVCSNDSSTPSAAGSSTDAAGLTDPGAAAGARLAKSGPVSPEVGRRNASAPVRGMLAPGSRRGSRLSNDGRPGVGSLVVAAAAGSTGATGWVASAAAASSAALSAALASAAAVFSVAFASAAAAFSAALASAFSERPRPRPRRLAGSESVLVAFSSTSVEAAAATGAADDEPPPDVVPVTDCAEAGATVCGSSGRTDGGSSTEAVIPPPGLRTRLATTPWRSARRETTKRPIRRAVSGVASAPCARSLLSRSSSAAGTPRPASVTVIVAPSAPSFAARRTGSVGGEKLSALSTSSVSRCTTSGAAASLMRVPRWDRICTRW